MRGRGANLVDYGLYNVTLNVDGKDIATKTIKGQPRPIIQVVMERDWPSRRDCPSETEKKGRSP